MAVKEIWINLPVKDVAKSKEFFTTLGFTLNIQNGNTENSACFLIGSKNVVLMLFSESQFKSFSRNELTDTTKSSEVLLSFDAESRQEVDELARKAVTAGGILFGEPTEVQGWMYGCGFQDLDGHRWNVLFMDKNKIVK